MNWTESPEFFVGRVGQLVDEEGRSYSALSVDVELDFEQVLLQSADEVDDQFYDEVLIVFLHYLACD